MFSAVVIATFLYLGLFAKMKDAYYHCFQVDPQTGAETDYGYLKIIRKNGKLKASLLEWGPDKINKTGLTYAAKGSLAKPEAIAVWDEQPGFNGHSWVFTRRKGKYWLSEEVADPTRLDYCRQVRRKEVPSHLWNVVAPLAPRTETPGTGTGRVWSSQ